MLPYLDLAYVLANTAMPKGDVLGIERDQPGFTMQKAAGWWSWINARLRKRYGKSQNANALPLGQQPAPFIASGTTPPAVSLSGRPALGSLQMQVAMVAAGPLGTARFAWSSDGGQTWTPDKPAALIAGAGVGILTSAAVVLGTTGITAGFAAGAYGLDNLYVADTPVPRVVLGWIVALLTVDLYTRRGVNPHDPMIEEIRAARDRALAEVKEAADSKEGLFDLPASEDADSAITTGGPLFYSEASPFVSADRQECEGVLEDGQYHGFYGDCP